MTLVVVRFLLRVRMVSFRTWTPMSLIWLMKLANLGEQQTNKQTNKQTEHSRLCVDAAIASQQGGTVAHLGVYVIL